MPQKHATQQPLKPCLFYARRSSEKVFTHGPFPTPEDAVDQVPELLQLLDGEHVEIGRMMPWTISIDTAALLRAWGDAARLTPDAVGAGWANTLAEAVGGFGIDGLNRFLALDTALNLVLSGWLAKNELNPAFGMIDQVLTCVMHQGSLRSLIARMPPENDYDAPRCGQHRTCAMRMEKVRCLLKAGHEGPCDFDQASDRVKCGEESADEFDVKTCCELPLNHEGPHQDIMGQCWLRKEDRLKCGDVIASGFGGPDLICLLPPGHGGNHKNRKGDEWSQPCRRQARCDSEPRCALGEGHEGPCNP